MQKPESNNKSYRQISLPNKLSVMLISDDSTVKAAMAMNVGVGHFSDPYDSQGLAHFLEHMLFMGTESFPDEELYEKTLKKYGGTYNAFTGDMNTVYFLDILPNYIKEIIPLFSTFFYEPLFAENANNREMNAVDSEHQKNILNDNWRINQLKCFIADPAHPLSKFGTGSLKTLNKPNIRDVLLKFYKTYYTAERMHLAILGKESLDELEQLVRQYFAPIPYSNSPTLQLFSELEVKPLTKNLGRAYKVKTINDTHQLQLTWQLSNYSKSYRTNPGSYVAEIIGDESRDSLYTLLKPRGCTAIMVDSMTEVVNYSEFNVTLLLLNEVTNEEVFALANICIGFLNFVANSIKNVSQTQARYQLYSRCNLRNFMYSQPEEPLESVMSMAIALEKYEDEFLLGALGREFDLDIINKYVNELISSPPLIVHARQTHENTSNWQREPHYGVEFTEVPFSVNPLTLPRFVLPSAENPFEPKSLDIVTEEPSLIAHPSAEVWYYQSTEYKLPKTYIYVNSNHPYILDAKSYIARYIYLQMFAEQLNEILYKAQQVGHVCTYGISNRSFTLTVGGFSDGIRSMFSVILNLLRNFELKSDIFVKEKEAHLKFCKAQLMEKPVTQLLRHLVTKMCPGDFTPQQLIAANNDITLFDVQAEKAQMFNDIRKGLTRMLVYGNETPDNAYNYADFFVKALNVSSVAPKQPISVQIPQSFNLQLTNPEETNTAFAYTYNLGRRDLDFKKYCSALLLENIISQPFFNSLRTEQQLGYLVKVKFQRIEENYAIIFVAQYVSSAFSIENVNQMFNKFIYETFPLLLQEMTAVDFDNHKSSMIRLLLQRPTTMTHSSGLMFDEIRNYTTSIGFNRSQEIAEMLPNLTKSDIEAVISGVTPKIGVATVS